MLRDRRGMALVLALLAVSFMVAVTVQLGSSVSWQMQAAANQSGAAQLDAMLLSGLRLAQAALLTDQRENEHDSAFDSWGNLDPALLSALFPGGSLNVQVTDLSGLLQINALALTPEEKAQQERKNKKSKGGPKADKEQAQRELWLRFLRNAAGLDDEAEAKALLDSLADWIDEDSEERENGAEQVYYSGQQPPCAAADKPIFLTEELFLVKGWRQFLRGETGDSKEAGPQAAVLQAVTAAGRDGKININTAPSAVLLALHEGMTEDLAAKLIEFRQNEENKDRLAEPDWYKTVPGFPGDIVFPEDLVTVSGGGWFKITAQAEFRGQRRSGEGLLRRLENQEQELLWWNVN